MYPVSAISVDPSARGLLRGIRADRFVKLLARRAYNLTGGEVSGRGSKGAESGHRIVAAQ